MELTVHCDGSGTGLADSASWVALVRINSVVHRVVGFRSYGSSNMAEIAAASDGLGLLEKTLSPDILEIKPTVTVFSDSEILVKGANGEYGQKSNKAQWCQIEYYKTIFDIKWVHVSRNTTPENTYCDKLAKPLRKQAIDPFLQKFPAFVPSQA